jgi:twitching motility protein PilT
MSTIQIDRLLDTVIRQGASDLHLSVGRKPTLRLHGTLRNLDTKVLDSDDCVALMKSITPERAQQELQEEGSCDFGFAYGTEARFRVAVFRQRGDITICLRDRAPQDRQGVDPPPPGPLHRDWSNWIGKDNDAGDDDRLHQR